MTIILDDFFLLKYHVLTSQVDEEVVNSSTGVVWVEKRVLWYSEETRRLHISSTGGSSKKSYMKRMRGKDSIEAGSTMRVIMI
jgi:hypothetical protein